MDHKYKGEQIPGDGTMTESVLLEITKHLNLFIDSLLEGVVVVDADANVVAINQSYATLLEFTRDEILNHNVNEIIDNTRMHIVTKTGIVERGQVQLIRGRQMIVDRIPVWHEGRVVGAIGVLAINGLPDVYKILESVHIPEEENQERTANSRRSFELHRPNPVHQIVGQSPAIAVVRKLADKAARTNSTVLITGETGTGKEVLAQYIHYKSAQANTPFISVNTSAIPENLIESELFGYEAGAFTGALRSGKPGQFELADGGTIFLDEIGDMPLTAQAKILRALESRQVQRIGATQARSISVRVISATNKSLLEWVQQGKFREDLYYRLNVIHIHLPPLRERTGDIPLLLDLYLEHFSHLLHKTMPIVSPEVLHIFTTHTWPGNIRELVNTVEALVTLVDNSEITVSDLLEYVPNLSRPLQPTPLRTEAFPANRPFTAAEISATPYTFSPSIVPFASPKTGFRQSVEQHELELLQRALDDAHGNKALAAQKLGIHRTTLYQKLKKYGLSGFPTP
ncbi:PAS domain-containing protein [Alicyclobacillaceae bacterium I2511]|nr:PAS domain-containing protein [Alicyclobacillaceae bacterium I2511]